MLLTALKMKLVALVTVAGLNTDDMPNLSSGMKTTLEKLASEQNASLTLRTGPGSDVAASFNIAVAKVSELAGAGDKDALYALAHWGVLGNNDVDKIADLYRKASEKGQLLAKAELAKMLMDAGAQKPEGIREAIRLIKEAEAADNKKAHVMLAQLHLQGVTEGGNGTVVVENSVPKAMQILEKGRRIGDTESTFGLAQIYSTGVVGVPQDHKKALDLLIEAGKQGNGGALSAYGTRLVNGDPDTNESPRLVRKDVAAALKMFEGSAAGGIAAANRILGQIYENGLGPDGADLKPDVTRAYGYYIKAANGNDPQALFRLGNAFETGVIKKPNGKSDDTENILIQPSLKSAFDLYLLAAQGGSAEAYFNLGVYYEKGVVVDKDLAKAAKLFSHASSAGLSQAQKRLADLNQSRHGVAQDKGRVALVIGNNHYTNLPDSRQLTSPVADAEDVAASLKLLGYTLVGDGAVGDASRDVMMSRIEAFAQAAKGAEAAVFYYSGHGVQVGEDNYLLPTDAPKLTGISVLKGRTILLRDTVMIALEEAGAKNKVIILDCCRDNPFAAQLETALAQVGKSIRTKSVGEISGYGSGFYLAFATSPGTSAEDGNGQRNSPFTAAMLKTLKTSASADIDFFFREVKAAMGDEQVSWTNHSLRGAFALLPGSAATPAAPK